MRVRGQVQGVGFRPFVHTLAQEFALTGWVLNDGEGVLLEVQGERCQPFLEALPSRRPPLARIEAIESAPIPLLADETGFTIRDSEKRGAATTAITPDAAVCPACLSELFDPADRRYRYPFLNCTHCGPRYTITRALPYDRPQTSMAGFALCSQCRAEYHDPRDRRFHAQPVACPTCGPQLSMPIADMVARLRVGAIVAIKGLGGFHLACDAGNAEAVARLRRVKQRNAKPFAVMLANLASAARLAEVDPIAAELLTAPSRPIVLLRRRGEPLSPAIAPDLAWLGIMLPYTPIHYLLFHEATGRPDGTGWLDQPQELALVMTSANPGGEPLAIGNDEARRRLTGIADAIADHDRDIVVRADDSVMAIVAGAPAFLRRGRGTVPEPIPLPRPVPPILAVGGHLKVTVCVTRGAHAFVSQHIGDLDNGATIAFLEETVAHLLDILEVRPVLAAHDRHPDFHATAFAQKLGVPTLAVQHHHAHVAAVLAEHGIEGPALGLALDGFGLGDDGCSWGGEMLLVDGPRFQRLGHLAPLAQPGGDAAARQPWRMAVAALHRLGRLDEAERRLGRHGPVPLMAQMIERGLNAPPTTSCGRWFDAACGLLGVRAVAGFEGEAPMVLESRVTMPRVAEGAWTVRNGVLDLLPLLERLLPVDAAEGADLFHGTLVAALVDWTLPVLAQRRLDRIALAGGCLMNRVLAEGLIAAYARHGIIALVARRVPPNDGGLSLGQAWVAAATLLEEG